MIAWSPLGAFGLVALAVAWAMAARVYAAGPDRRPNRRLAALLATDGLSIGVLVGVTQLAPDAASARLLFAVQGIASLVMPLAYLAFLATLDIPMVRWLRSRAVWVAAGGTAAVVAMLVAARPDWFVTGVIAAPPPARWMPTYTPGPVLVATTIQAVQLFGLAAAVSLLRRAVPGTPTRARAKAYMAAFGIRDAAAIALFALGTALHAPAAAQAGAPTDPSVYPWFLGGWAVTMLVFVALMSYGLLRTQFLDIDLRVKRTLRRGTVATVLVGVGVLVAEAAQLVVEAPEAAYLGVVAGGLLVLALARLNRLAQRVADAVMPGVQDSQGYLDRRKVEVYQAALEESLDEAGGVRAADQALLTRLRGELGVADRDHALLLHAVQASRRRGARGLDLAPGGFALGRYRILAALGTGAHGRTFLAEDTALGRRVALKALMPGRADAAPVLREARAVAALQHPHVVAVHDVERVGDEVLLVMEHVEGGSLQQRLRVGPLAPAVFRDVADGLLRGLEAVHAAGIVHRDVKPSNVLLTRDGQAKLADFGIAHLPGLETTVGGADGTALGTIPYMSPEQAKGRKVTERSDLFSAAATLYEAWTGLPFLRAGPRESAVELQMRAAGAGPFDGMLEGPAALRAWFAKALDPTPARRFASAAVMRAALAEALPAPEPLTKG